MTSARWSCPRGDAAVVLHVVPSEPPLRLCHPRLDKASALDVEIPLPTEDPEASRSFEEMIDARTARPVEAPLACEVES